MKEQIVHHGSSLRGRCFIFQGGGDLEEFLNDEAIADTEESQRVSSMEGEWSHKGMVEGPFHGKGDKEIIGRVFFVGFIVSGLRRWGCMGRGGFNLFVFLGSRPSSRWDSHFHSYVLTIYVRLY